MSSFVAARMTKELTEAQWDKLITALDAWEVRENQTVNYKRILGARVAKATVS